MPIRSYRDLVVWQKGMDLTVDVYKLTALFPSTERFRLVDQLTRASASIPGNLAEGHERGTRKDYAHFVSIARGSLAETETFLTLSERLGYVTSEQLGPIVALAEEVGRMLNVLHSRLLRGR